MLAKILLWILFILGIVASIGDLSYQPNWNKIPFAIDIIETLMIAYILFWSGLF